MSDQLERKGTVAVVRDGVAWVALCDESACSTCATGAGCGIGPIVSLFRRKAPSLVPVRLEGRACRPGMQVRLLISGARVAQTAALVYLVPLAAMLSGAWFAGVLVGQLTDAILLAGALTGLGLSWLWLASWRGRRLPVQGELSVEFIER